MIAQKVCHTNVKYYRSRWILGSAALATLLAHDDPPLAGQFLNPDTSRYGFGICKLRLRAANAYALPRWSSFAPVTAGIPRIGSRMDSDTSPSRRTSETASAPRVWSRLPSANVAMFTPCLPSVEPTWLMTPGSSRLRR